MSSANVSDSGDGSNATDAIAVPPSAGGGLPVHATVAPKMQTSNSRDTCAWYSGERCSALRDCFDCLNVAVSRQEVHAARLCRNSDLVGTLSIDVELTLSTLSARSTSAACA